MTGSADREELLRKEQFNFALFQHHPAPMTVVDRLGRVVKSNLARRSLPVPLPDLGVPIFDPAGSPEERDLGSALVSCMAKGHVFRAGEHSFAGRVLDLTFSPFPDGAIVISPDITEKKRAEEEAREQQEQLIRAQKLATIGTLVSGVAHEVSNPNNALLLSATALGRILPGLLDAVGAAAASGSGPPVGGRPFKDVRDEVAEQMDVILRAARRIKGTVDELKDYARAENRAEMEKVDVNAVVKGACSLMGATIRRATDRFSLDLADGLPSVNGNARRLEQVVVNLISNSCQALENRRQALAVRTSFDAASRRVAVSVKDEGRGIPPAALARIKDPFFTTRHDEGGTGLGLSVSDKIAVSHGGSLEFASEAGKGTTAALLLPAAESG
jgi:signal transduction histidine kinase